MTKDETIRRLAVELSKEVKKLTDHIRQHHYAVLQLDDDPARTITLRLESLSSTILAEAKPE